MFRTRWFYANKGIFKGLLFIIAIFLIIAEVTYIQRVVDRLREEQLEFVRLQVSQYSQAASDESIENFSFIFDNIIRRINVPVILSSPDGIPANHMRIDEIEQPPYSQENLAELKELMAAMDAENPPVPIMWESNVISMIHFGDSELIRQLNWLPVIQAVMVGLFILLGFIGFNNIRKSEQRFIWVGMAKETAHQLGTPISSLSGWTELLAQSDKDNKNSEVISEMSHDIDRLTRVAQRFSQIGSNTGHSEQNVAEILNSVAEYFRRRLPQLGKSVEIHEKFRVDAVSVVNRDLIEWTIENLIKNGLDAIEGNEGSITITLDTDSRGKFTLIDIADTGKGMTKKHANQVFKPGFSTKKRGWGLGLNLSRRIIEDYHGGKLFIKSTRPDGGTTMRIMLRNRNRT